MSAEPAGGSERPNDDVALLSRLGYAQELRRRMSAFSNFAIAFSTICILAGGITSLQLGVSAVGGAAAGLVWPLGVAFAFVVALSMAQVASAFPTAGGLYHWSAILGGKGWGWATAWFNLAGLVFVTAAVNVGAYSLFVQFIGPMLGIDPAKLGVAHQIAGVALISASHALLNHHRSGPLRAPATRVKRRQGARPAGRRYRRGFPLNWRRRKTHWLPPIQCGGHPCNRARTRT